MMMQELLQRFELALSRFRASETIRRLNDGRLTVEEYRSILRQIFHHTRENPQLQALATVYFRGRQRDMVRLFFSHAASEVGHDQLALNDFVTLGGNAEHVPYENPLPATSALLAYGFYQIHNLNPLGYLGYLFFLEFNGTSSGESLMTALRNIGVPDAGMTFLRDHAEIDIGHNKLMEKYVKHMIHSPADLDSVSYAMNTTGRLYAQMIDDAARDVNEKFDVGWNWEELNADGVSPPQSLTEVA